MSIIRPFAAIRYSAPPGGDISTRIAPPYDVLDAADKAALLQRDARNFVAVDLPVVPAKHAGPPEVYEACRRQIEAWLADGTMTRDRSPALYVYYQRYTHNGVDYTRRMFFARLRLEPFGEGSVFPHERTFGGPKEDRLALTKAVRANLSPIFGLYEDGDNVLAKTLEPATRSTPLCTGSLDGVESRIWALTDPASIETVCNLMKSKPVYIADGHHRYGTSLLYRDSLQTQGPLPEDHPANFVLCVLCAMEDPGLLILPTHRVLPGVGGVIAALRADPELRLAPLSVGSPEEAVKALAAHGPQAVGLWETGSDVYTVVTPARPDILDAIATEHSTAWRRLGLAFLHAYLLDRVVTPRCCGGAAPEVQYIKSAAPAIQAARETRGCAFLLQPTTMQELRSVCQAGDLMPQKSTYFYPKLASGLVINPLTA